MGLLGTVQREKQEFNERVVALRTRKRELIKELSSIADQAGLPDCKIISLSGNSALATDNSDPEGQPGPRQVEGGAHGAIVGPRRGGEGSL